MRNVKKWYRLSTSIIFTLCGYLAFYLFIRTVIYLSFQSTHIRRLPAVCQARDNSWRSAMLRPHSCLLHVPVRLKTTPKADELNQREAVGFLTQKTGDTSIQFHLGAQGAKENHDATGRVGLGKEAGPGQARGWCAFDKGEWGEPVKGSCAGTDPGVGWKQPSVALLTGVADSWRPGKGVCRGFWFT